MQRGQETKRTQWIYPFILFTGRRFICNRNKKSNVLYLLRYKLTKVVDLNRRYLIFYCPLNLFYKCVSFLPIKLVLVALKEVVRTRKIAAGVHHAHHAYHHGFFIMVIVGYVKGWCDRAFGACIVPKSPLYSPRWKGDYACEKQTSL